MDNCGPSSVAGPSFISPQQQNGSNPQQIAPGVRLQHIPTIGAHFPAKNKNSFQPQKKRPNKKKLPGVQKLSSKNKSSKKPTNNNAGITILSIPQLNSYGYPTIMKKPEKYDDLSEKEWILCHKSIEDQMSLPENSNLPPQEEKQLRRRLKKEFVRQRRELRKLPEKREKIAFNENERDSIPNMIRPAEPSTLIHSGAQKELKKESVPNSNHFLSNRSAAPIKTNGSKEKKHEKHSSRNKTYPDQPNGSSKNIIPLMDVPLSSFSLSHYPSEPSNVRFFNGPSTSSAFPPVETNYFNANIPAQQFVEQSSRYESTRNNSNQNGYNYLREKWWEPESRKISDREVAANIVNGLTGTTGNDMNYEYANGNGYDYAQQSIPMVSTDYTNLKAMEHAEAIALEKRILEIDQMLLKIDKKEQEESFQVEREFDFIRRLNDLQDRERELEDLERSLKKANGRTNSRERKHSGSRYIRRSRSRSMSPREMETEKPSWKRKEEIKILKRQKAMRDAKKRDGLRSVEKEKTLKLNTNLPRHRVRKGKTAAAEQCLVYDVSDDDESQPPKAAKPYPLPFSCVKKDRKRVVSVIDISEDEDETYKKSNAANGNNRWPDELEGISDGD